jgi:hypothetical protein
MTITIFSGVSYARMVQRPTMLARALARLGHRVTYVTPESREHGMSDLDGAIAIQKLVPREQDILWVFSGWAASIISRVRYAALVLDVLDDESVMGCPTGSTRFVADHADCIFAVSVPLYEQFRARYEHVFLLPNAFESDWASLGSDASRRDAAIYAGAWPAPWLTTKALDNASVATEVWIAGGHGFLPGYAITNRPRIMHLGEVPYAQLPGVLKGAKVGLIPFRDCAASRYADPIKFYQYLGCGLAVLVTPYVPVPFVHPQVHVAREDDWAEAVRAAIANHDPDACREAVRAHTWEHRSLQITEAFTKVGIL